MTHRSRSRTLLLLLLATLIVPPAALAQEASQVTWRDLMDRAVTQRLTNGTADESWTATVTPLAPDAAALPELQVEPAQTNVTAAETVEFRFALKARPSPGADVRYLLTVERKQGKNPPTYERRIIHVQPVFRLPPQGSVKYVLNASRSVPFWSPWAIETRIPLTVRPAEVRVTEAAGQPLGVVTATSSSGLDHGAVVKWASLEGDPGEIALKMDFSPWSSAKMEGGLTFPDGQSRNVVVQTSDMVIYPFFVICAGVGIAYAVKHYVTRGRPLLVLRASLADTEARLRVADQEFQRAAAHSAISGFDILPAWRRHRSEAEANLDMVSLRGGELDRNNDLFTKASADIDAARTLPSRWLAFEVTLRQIAALGGGIAKLVPPDGLQARPTIGSHLAAIERGTELRSVDELASLMTEASTAVKTAGLWRVLWDRAVRLSTVASAAAGLVDIGEAQRRLWEGFDDATLAEVKRLVEKATNDIVTAGGAAPAERESAAVTAAPVDSTPSPTREITQLQRQDRLAVLVALVLAVLSGLNAEYFGKPFGSLADYSRVLAWALAANIAVDIAALALDRLRSTLGGSTAVTRA